MIFRSWVGSAVVGVLGCVTGCSRPVSISATVPIPPQPLMTAALSPQAVLSGPATTGPVLSVIPVTTAKNRVRVTLPDGKIAYDKVITLTRLPEQKKLPALPEGSELMPADKYAIGYRFAAPGNLALIEPVAGGFKNHVSLPNSVATVSIHYKHDKPDAEASSMNCASENCGPHDPSTHIEVYRVPD